jgi:hypothetical protein
MQLCRHLAKIANVMITQVDISIKFMAPKWLEFLDALRMPIWVVW